MAKKASTTQAKKAGAKKAEPKKESAEVKYPDLRLELYIADPGAAKLRLPRRELTADDAKRLLGWEAETDKTKFGSIHTLADTDGRKVRLLNNSRNRPFTLWRAKQWQGEILRGKWRFNGETFIIGKHGMGISLQHRLAGLVLATEEWRKNPERWPFWKTEPTMPGLIVYGIEEDDATVNTVDTGKSRDLWEVICRSEYFSSLQLHDRKICSRMTAFATRVLWHRTGASVNAWIPKHQSHSDFLDFITRHPRILEMVKHVWEEDGKERKLTKYLSPGTFAGMLYLMAAGKSDPKTYADNPQESTLDLTQWDQACKFAVLLAQGAKEVLPIKAALGKMLQDNRGSGEERRGLLVLAWNCFVAGDPITEDDLQLEYTPPDEDGVKTLTGATPVCGGIDLGNPEAVDEEHIVTADPTPEDITNGKKAIRDKKTKVVLIPSKAGKAWAIGDVPYVFDPDGEHYLATITEGPYESDGAELGRCMVQDALGKEWEVEVTDLSTTDPNATPTKSAPSAPKPQPSSPQTSTPKKPIITKPGQLKVGVLRWVILDNEEPWLGRVMQLSQTQAWLRVEQGHKGAGNTMTIPLAALRREQPGKILT